MGKLFDEGGGNGRVITSFPARGPPVAMLRLADQYIHI
jgi:hypothetical protein